MAISGGTNYLPTSHSLFLSAINPNQVHCTAPAATNYPSLRNSLNGWQGHPPFCLSPPDRPRVTRLDSNDVRTRSIYSTISIDDINAQSGWSLKTEKIRLKWHVCLDTTHTIRHLFLAWTSLYPSLHFLNLTQSYAALPLAFFNLWLALLIWTVHRHISAWIKHK
jgi:hypothetical protein